MVTLTKKHFGNFVSISPTHISNGAWMAKADHVANRALFTTKDAAASFLKLDSANIRELSAVAITSIMPSDATKTAAVSFSRTNILINQGKLVVRLFLSELQERRFLDETYVQAFDLHILQSVPGSAGMLWADTATEDDNQPWLVIMPVADKNDDMANQLKSAAA